MSDSDNGTVFEAFVHGFVDDRLSGDIDVCCGLVNQDNSSRFQNGSSDTDQLSLPHTQVLSVLGNLSFQTVTTIHHLFQCASVKSRVQLLVVVLSQWIQIL